MKRRSSCRPVVDGGSLVLPTLKAVNTKTIKLESVLASRVLTGFLRQYADSQHSAENLAFVQAELEFRDGFRAFSKRGTADAAARKLFDFFINEDTAEMQVCLTSDEYHLIKLRVNGDSEAQDSEAREQDTSIDMFTPLLKGCKLTIERDMFPRFRRSDFAKDMLERLDSPVRDYLMDQEFEEVTLLDADPPVDLVDSTMEFSFEQVIEDCHLSNALHDYLTKQMCAENIACIQEIQLFRLRHGIVELSPTETQDRAFAIYFRFLHPGASEEVSVDSSQRHAIGGHLAKPLPPLDLFDRLYGKIAQQIKLQNFKGFTQSDAYRDLVHILRAVKAARHKAQRSSSVCTLM